MRWPMAVIWSPGLRVSLSQPVPAMRLGLGPPEIVLTAEEPTPEWTQKLGQAPPIYSAEINYCLDGLALGQLTPGPVVISTCHPELAAAGGGSAFRFGRNIRTWEDSK